MLSTHQSDQDFLRVLHRHEPVTVQELCEITGVTATAVRQRLTRLQGAGLIVREVAHQQRGRPLHTYCATEPGIRSLGNDQARMAALLWRHVMQIESPEVKEKLLSNLRQSLVDEFGAAGGEGTLQHRLEQMCENLTGFGFDIDCVTVHRGEVLPETGAETIGSSLPVLREYNCPYHEIAEEDPAFCEFERSVFAEILGASVERSACRFDGHRCCEFQVSEADQF